MHTEGKLAGAAMAGLCSRRFVGRRLHSYLTLDPVRDLPVTETNTSLLEFITSISRGRSERLTEIYDGIITSEMKAELWVGLSIWSVQTPAGTGGVVIDGRWAAV